MVTSHNTVFSIGGDGGLSRRILEQGTYLHMDDYMVTTSTKTSEELMNLLKEKSKKLPSFSVEVLNEDSIEENTKYITQLKSQLKHCKNHMQRLNIERELNVLYKNKER